MGEWDHSISWERYRRFFEEMTAEGFITEPWDDWIVKTLRAEREWRSIFGYDDKEDSGGI